MNLEMKTWTSEELVRVMCLGRVNYFALYPTGISLLHIHVTCDAERHEGCVLSLYHLGRG